MEVFDGAQMGQIYFLRLDPLDDVLLSIKHFVKEHNIDTAIVVSGIGTLDRSVLHMVTTIGYPPVEYFDKKTDTALELVSVDGIIADGEPHLHVTISDKDVAYGGHLEEGCRVLYLAELVIVEAKGIKLSRQLNEKNINILQYK